MVDCARNVAVAVSFVCLFASGPARGWESLEVRQWLGEPGVRLLAVEFYATWCKPCQKAIPKWKELQDKYRKRGLRLVVVAVQSEGSCSSPSWAPDKVVCDYDGEIAEQWRASNLPQAFLWSWQGNLLVANGHVDQVEAAVEEYFSSAPRILVDDPVDLRGDRLAKKKRRQIKQLVREEMRRAAKFEMVADRKELKEIKRLRREGHSLDYDESTQCKLGEDVSANSQLRVTLATTSRGTNLRLELFSLERGCLTASSRAPVLDRDVEAAVIEAVAKLKRALIGEVGVPAAPPEPAKPPKIALSEPRPAEPVRETPPQFKEQVWFTAGGVIGGIIPVPGIQLEFYRWRSQHFNFVGASAFLVTNMLIGDGDDSGAGIAVAGVGPRADVGPGGKLDVGVLIYPISFSNWQMTSQPYYNNFLHTQVYARYNFPTWHLELAALMPLIWSTERVGYEGDSIPLGLYGGEGIPLQVSLGGGY